IHSTRRPVSTELDYSSMSPEYSAASSGDSVAGVAETLVSPRSQDLQDSFSVSTWQECSERGEGEWGHFWANYNNSLARVPVSRYYDQCPTPYRSEDIELADLEFSTDGSRKRSPENIKTINSIIRNEGIRLTPRETQNVIKCAHILGNVLTKAIERQTKDRDYISDKIQELKIEKPNPETE
ncbi:jg15956, partial [Pararge aegeria aegeria]